MVAYRCGALAGLPTLLIMLFANEASPENIGHLFVVSFPNENQQANSQPFLVVIPKINATINVTVQMPLRNDLLRPIAKTLTNGRSATILLPATVRMTGSSTEANGIEVLSTGEISLYVSSSAVGFFALPCTSLGDTYRVASYLPPPGHHITLALLGVTNDTDVNVTIPSGNVNLTWCNGRSYAHGDVLRVTLHAYETVRLESEQDLTGVFLQGAESFSVVSGLVSSSCACAESTTPCGVYTVEQLVPTSQWGRDFATLSYSPDGDTVRVLANEDNTIVTMMTSHNSTSFNLSESAYVDVRLDSNETGMAVFHATRPVRLQQSVEGTFPNNDVPWSQTMRLMVPHTGEHTNRYLFYIDVSNRSRLFHLFFNSEDISDGLLLDGRAVNLTAGSNISDGARRWQSMAFKVTLSRGVHVLRHPHAVFAAMTSDGVLPERYGSTAPPPIADTSATNAVAYVAESANQDDGINLHAAGGFPSGGDKTGITRTVVAVIVSLSSAVFLVVVCILGFLAAELLCRSDNFNHAKVTPFLDSPPHD